MMNTTASEETTLQHCLILLMCTQSSTGVCLCVYVSVGVSVFVHAPLCAHLVAHIVIKHSADTK